MPRHVVVVVVVHAEEVDGLRDLREVAVVDARREPVVAHVLEEVGRVGAEHQRLQVHPVPDRVDAARGLEVDGIGRVVRHGVGEVEGDAEPDVAPRGIREAPEPLDGQAVREVLVVHGGEARLGVGEAGRVLAAGVADER